MTKIDKKKDRNREHLNFAKFLTGSPDRIS